MNNKILKYVILCVFIIVIILVQEYYTIRRINFICNDDVCTIFHLHSSGRIISQQDIDINNIAKFTYKLEHNSSNFFTTKSQRRHNKIKVYHIYVKYKDNSEHRLQYVSLPRNRLYQIMKLTDKLNNDIKKEPININIDLPSMR